MRLQISLDSQALSMYDIYLTNLIVYEFVTIAKIGNVVKRKVPPKAVNLMVNSVSYIVCRISYRVLGIVPFWAVRAESAVLRQGPSPWRAAK